ncbi:MAG: hypothetical protein AAFY01_03260, partial [Pseudomonadota bacterium]
TKESKGYPQAAETYAMNNGIRIRLGFFEDLRLAASHGWFAAGYLLALAGRTSRARVALVDDAPEWPKEFFDYLLWLQPIHKSSDVKQPDTGTIGGIFQVCMENCEQGQQFRKMFPDEWPKRSWPHWFAENPLPISEPDTIKIAAEEKAKHYYLAVSLGQLHREIQLSWGCDVP